MSDKRVCTPLKGSCTKKVTGKNVRCAEHKAEARKATWRRATDIYRTNIVAKDKTPHRIIFGEKPTRWARLHPKEALKLAKAGNRPELVPIFEKLAEKAAKASEKAAPAKAKAA